MTTVWTDDLGNEWDFTINLGAARRIESADWSSITKEKVSFFRPEQDLMFDLLKDTRAIALMIWCIIQPEAKKKGILHQRIYNSEGQQSSPENATYFEDLFTSKNIAAGKEAFWQACHDFFQLHGVPLAFSVTALIDIQKEIVAKITPSLQAMVLEMRQKISPEIDAFVNTLKTNGTDT